MAFLGAVSKRPADNDPAGGSKKNKAGSSGGGGIAGGNMGGEETDPQPIPRPFRKESQIFTFTTSSWEEIKSDSLKYFTGSVTYAGLFGNSFIINQLGALAPTFPIMKIGPMKVRLSNFIFFLDEVGTQGSTPITTTAITNQMYFVHMDLQSLYNNYFILGQNPQVATGTLASILKLSAAPFYPSTGSANDILRPLDFTGAAAAYNLEDLIIARPNAAVIKHPNGTVPANDTTAVCHYDTFTSPRVIDRKCFQLVRPGDTVEFTIGGLQTAVPLPTNGNYFSPGLPANNLSFYHYPGRFRPLTNKTVNYSQEINNLALHAAPLHHHFFTCPPIKNASNAVLAQRVSALMEIELTVEVMRREDYNFLSTASTIDNNVNVYELGQWDQSTIGTAANNIFYEFHS